VNDAVFDTSFWINADRAGLLAHVLARYTLWYTHEVAAELKPSFASAAVFWQHVRTGQVREVRPVQRTLQEFGQGERSAIDVARERPDWMLLIDDLRPYRAARMAGLQSVCTPLLTVQFLREGVLDDIDALVILTRLASLGTVSPRLVDEGLGEYAAWLSGEEG
jgi:predicted nucleic acid-binding protein